MQFNNIYERFLLKNLKEIVIYNLKLVKILKVLTLFIDTKKNYYILTRKLKSYQI